MSSWPSALGGGGRRAEGRRAEGRWPTAPSVFASRPQFARLKPMLFEGNERKQREQEMQRAGRLPPGQALTQVAGSALWLGAEVRSRHLGFPHRRADRKT